MFLIECPHCHHENLIFDLELEELLCQFCRGFLEDLEISEDEE